MTLTSGVGVNEGHFILVIAVSLYVNPKLIYGARLWDKCYCVMLEVVLIIIQRERKGGGEGALWFWGCLLECFMWLRTPCVGFMVEGA